MYVCISLLQVQKRTVVLHKYRAVLHPVDLYCTCMQDTLRQPPGSQRTMKRAVDIGVGMSFVFYLTVAVAGYLAFGNGER